MLNRVQLFVTPGTVALQDPLSMEFSRQEYYSGLPFPTPEDLPNPGMKPTSLVSPALAGGFSTTVPPGRPILLMRYMQIKEIVKYHLIYTIISFFIKTVNLVPSS